jgi:hypothetical protein
MELRMSVSITCYNIKNHESVEEYFQRRYGRLNDIPFPTKGDVIILENGLETNVRFTVFDFEEDLINIKLDPIIFGEFEMEDCLKSIEQLKKKGWK